MELLDIEDEPVLHEIMCNNVGNVEHCTADMLMVWLERNPDASWNQLLQVLKSDKPALASKVEEMLINEGNMNSLCLCIIRT